MFQVTRSSGKNSCLHCSSLIDVETLDFKQGGGLLVGQFVVEKLMKSIIGPGEVLNFGWNVSLLVIKESTIDDFE